MGVMYPYKLYEFNKQEAVYDDATGTFTPGNEEWVFISKCRDEVNGGGQKIETADGEVYIFGAIIYMPKKCPEVQLGARIKVEDEEGKIRFEGDNRLWKKEKYHARLWV